VKRFAPHIAERMFLWRPVIRGMCTMHELRTVYTFGDLADMHEALNLQDAIAGLPPPEDPKRRR
jgi:hypothetical protein